jgi:hypothetical protein
MTNWNLLPLGNNSPIFHIEFFPCIAYLTKIEQEKQITIELYESFVKQSLRNRCVVLSSNGLQNIIVPIVKNKEKRITTKEAEISYKENWQLKAWRTIFSAYGKSPYFEYYADEIQDILIKKKYKYLYELDLSIMMFIKKAFELSFQIGFTEDFNRDNNIRNYTSMFSIQSREEDGKGFEEYFQCFSYKFPFQKNLSCLDLLFCKGKEGGNYIRNGKPLNLLH